MRSKWLSLLLLAVTSCDLKVDSPFSTDVRTEMRDHNHHVIAKLNSRPTLSGPMRIGVITDSHLNYKDLERTLAKLNTLNLDWIVHLGDFTNTGTNVEYEAFVEIIRRSATPILVVVGNHDSIGAGSHLFRKIFGEPNIAFLHKGRRFLLYNSNRIQYENKDGYSPAWLDRELAKASEDTFLFQHVNPDHEVYFSPGAKIDTLNAWRKAPRLRAILHGHQHIFYERPMGEFTMRGIGRVEGEQYAILELGENGTDILRNCPRDGGCNAVTF